jgi:hypothetical protein
MSNLQKQSKASGKPNSKRKETCNSQVFDDQYFIDNGFWTKHEETINDSVFYVKTAKWNRLMERCFRNTSRIVVENKRSYILHTLIDMKIIDENIEDDGKKKYKSGYRKKIRPEGYLTLKQRKELQKKRQAEKEKIRKLKNGN